MQSENSQASRQHSVLMATVNVTLLFTVFGAYALTVIALASLIILKLALEWCNASGIISGNPVIVVFR